METVPFGMIAVDVSPVVPAVGTARVHGLHVTRFAGSFTLPFEAQWGGATLPAGEYVVRYGVQTCGTCFVEFLGKAKGSPHGIVLIQGRGRPSTTMNALVCIHEGNSQIIRSLEMSVIGESVSFALPRGHKPMAHRGSRNANIQLAGNPRLAQPVPTKLNES